MGDSLHAGFFAGRRGGTGMTVVETRRMLMGATPVTVVRPTVASSCPGVLVLHEAWGLTPDIVRATERVGAAGFVAVAPDLLAGGVGVRGIVAEILSGRGRTVELASHLIDWMSELPETTGRVGVIGFSMGGALALLMDRHPSVAAIAANYCLVPPAAMAHRPVPVVGSFGGRDRLLPRADRPLRRKLGRAGVSDHDLVSYRGAGHSFMTEIGTPRQDGRWGRLLGLEYNPVAADHAWARTITFMRDRLHENVNPGLSAGFTTPPPVTAGPEATTLGGVEDDSGILEPGGSPAELAR